MALSGDPGAAAAEETDDDDDDVAICLPVLVGLTMRGCLVRALRGDATSAGSRLPRSCCGASWPGRGVVASADAACGRDARRLRWMLVRWWMLVLWMLERWWWWMSERCLALLRRDSSSRSRSRRACSREVKTSLEERERRVAAGKGAPGGRSARRETTGEEEREA